MLVQSVLFNKHLISLKDAIKWINDNNYHIMKIDETDNLYRFRQIDPKPYEKENYIFRITKINDVISLVIMYPPKKRYKYKYL